MTEIETYTGSSENPIKCQQFSLKDSTFFDQIKNSNFSDLNKIVRSYKGNSVLQQSNSPDLENKKQQQQQQNELTQGKENKTTTNSKIIQIQQILEMNICKQNVFIDFGSSLPGYVLEEVLVLRNLTSVPFSVKTTVLCFDEELNELDEYVFSVRREENYDYNESLITKLQPQGTAKLFVALKSPNLKSERKINGIVQVKISGASVSGILSKEIVAMIKVPRIVCLKELFSTDYQRQVIKLAMKMTNNKSECKVPFKNQMPFVVKAEFELIQNKKNIDEYEFSINPEFGILQPNQMAMVVIVGKKNECKAQLRKREGVKKILANQLECMMAKKKKQEKEKIERNAVLLIKILHSTIILCFPTIIEIY